MFTDSGFGTPKNGNPIPLMYYRPGDILTDLGSFGKVEFTDFPTHNPEFIAVWVHAGLNSKREWFHVTAELWAKDYDTARKANNRMKKEKAYRS